MRIYSFLGLIGGLLWWIAETPVVRNLWTVTNIYLIQIQGVVGKFTSGLLVYSTVCFVTSHYSISTRNCGETLDTAFVISVQLWNSFWENPQRRYSLRAQLISLRSSSGDNTVFYSGRTVRLKVLDEMTAVGIVPWLIFAILNVNGIIRSAKGQNSKYVYRPN